MKSRKNYKTIDRPRKKKSLGQHFLRKQSVVDHMISRVKIDPETSVLEIGGGDGFLTKSILAQTDCKRLWTYEIDPEWVEFLRENINDERYEVKHQNILDLDFRELESHNPWVLLANLPYQITFPIFFLLQKNRDLFSEGVVMVQEEVAQKIVATRGKKYSATSLFLQHFFDFELMEKIEPEAFSPKPKVFSRLIYFKPKFDQEKIDEEEKFWKFLKSCFMKPRQKLKNNLKATTYDYSNIPEETLSLRAQQMAMKDFVEVWAIIKK